MIDLVTRHGVQFAISGAFALHEHTGIWRDTKDLDLFLPAPEVPKALDLLRRDGFETEITDPIWLAKARRGEYFVDLITGMSNAVVRANDWNSQFFVTFPEATVVGDKYKLTMDVRADAAVLHEIHDHVPEHRQAMLRMAAEIA